MKKVVAISVWGKNPRYIEGAKINAKLSEIYYPDWEFRVYAKPEIHHLLSGLNLVIPTHFNSGAFWRFEPAFDPNVTCMISRDADSRISKRESEQVNLWLKTPMNFHIIRDHPRHYDFPILAGMWGCRNSIISELFETAKFYSTNNSYLVDQIWLRDIIFPKIQHSVFYSMIDKDSERTIDFVGQGYDENNKPLYPIL